MPRHISTFTDLCKYMYMQQWDAHWLSINPSKLSFSTTWTKKRERTYTLWWWWWWGGGYLYIVCFHLGEKIRFPEIKYAIGKNLKYKTRTLQFWNNCHYMGGENSVKDIISKRHTRLVLRNPKAHFGIFWFRITNDQLLFGFINMRHICIYFLYH